jgi:hypothetical protein
MDYEAGGMPVVSPECFWPGFRWLTSFAAWQTSEAISYKLIQHLSIKSRSVYIVTLIFHVTSFLWCRIYQNHLNYDWHKQWWPVWALLQ